MQTQSHFLLAAAAIMPLRRWPGAVFAPALLVGAALPDIPLFLLTVAGEIYYRWLVAPPATNIMEYLHFNLFYNHPLWIIGHNFFHSLLIDGALLLVGLWWWKQRGSRWGMMLFWLAGSMLVHVGIDIFTHHSDGPLFLFPIDWRYRFASPISYWEPAYGGRQFAAFERALDLVLLGLLLLTYGPAVWRRYLYRR
ncbi:MAG: metal-dependent hydrolase [Anaerolineales bacterium]|nr:metal-dependent hydrolase [Anaerolineales bacterium]